VLLTFYVHSAEGTVRASLLVTGCAWDLVSPGYTTEALVRRRMEKTI